MDNNGKRAPSKGRGRGISGYGQAQQRTEMLGPGARRQPEQPTGSGAVPRQYVVQSAWGGDGPRVPTPQVVGRASHHQGAASVPHPPIQAERRVAAEPPKEGENNRGGVRGNRLITQIIRSRPDSCVKKSGEAGKKITVQANYFRILKKPDWIIHQYRVDFSPDIDMKRARFAYLAQHKEMLGGYVFDGTLLFSTTFLPQPEVEFLTKNREEEIIKVKIKHVGIVDSSDAQMLQILNIILRRAMDGLSLQLVGRNFFDPVAKIGLQQYNMEIWPGYITSIRQHERDILLCCEISHKIMRTDSVYSIMTTCIREQANFQDYFKRLVVGSIVLTDYNNKTYRIDDVDYNLSPMSKFQTKNGEISYVEYYKKRYNLEIRDKKQPMLISFPKARDVRGGREDPIILVPELSRATGMTDAMRENFRLMRAMGDHTRLPPDRRIERLRAFNTRLQQTRESAQLFQLWNMQLDKELVEIPARVLNPTTITFGDNKTYLCDNRADWSREFRSNRMFVSKDIKRWYVIAPRRNMQEVQNFVSMCVRAARGMKMNIAEPRYLDMNDDRNGTYSQAIDNAVVNDPQILMLVLVRINADKYSCIKKKCCVDRPIPSQVVTLGKIAPRADKAGGLMSIATKVVIQMNAKLSGAPWITKIPIEGLMVVGFDVCHSAKEKNKSYGALIATMDQTKSYRYYSHVMEHLKGQELSNEISMSMSFALEAYRTEHGSLPKWILFYRDGVGEGQMHQVFNLEVKAIREKINSIYASHGAPPPATSTGEGDKDKPQGSRLAYIIVSKRINTRFFTQRGNPVPGTVVDDIVTLPERYDFFLVSQSVNQGTVAPTNYSVIYDNSGLSPDKLQILTYKMTHMYYNWSGTCRVPAVCQYAHKLAFLVAEFIHRSPSNALENQLYFL